VEGVCGSGDEATESQHGCVSACSGSRLALSTLSRYRPLRFAPDASTT